MPDSLLPHLFRTVNFDDHDWDQLGPPATSAARDSATFWKVAAGVAAGMVLGAALVYGVDRREAPGARTSNLPPVRSATSPPLPREPARAGPAALPKLISEPPAAAASTSTAVLPTESMPVDAGKAQPRDGVPSHRAAQLAAERRDRAWARFYQRPAQCDDNPTRTTMVECANHFIRAKREFEGSYGPLKP